MLQEDKVSLPLNMDTKFSNIPFDTTKLMHGEDKRTEVIDIPKEVVNVLIGNTKVDDNIVLFNGIKYDVKDRLKDMGEVSDGYHTFNELYEIRAALTIALFKSIESHNHEYPTGNTTWKSKLHSDKTMFDNFFIVGIGKNDNKCYITFHYPIEMWDVFDMCDELPNAPEWDGHDTKQVIARLKDL